MPSHYGIIQRLLAENFEEFNDKVLIESPFIETTRSGTYLRSVVLALTSNNLIIATKSEFQPLFRKDSIHKCKNGKVYHIRSFCPIQMVKLIVFKCTHRQLIKVRFCNDTEKYYELRKFRKRKIFWNLWCHHISELAKEPKAWPFAACKSKRFSYDKLRDGIECINIRALTIENEEKNRRRWHDKYLYLGTKREAEDHVRPIPIPGLGPADELKLVYLKSRYFGIWDQSEHWVQCSNSTPDTTCDYNLYTYTGEPTSNVTYTSIFKVRIAYRNIYPQQKDFPVKAFAMLQYLLGTYLCG